ncbi:MAG: FKBP-type peptidyl-prolyl cis-trans isomerase [Planctomycetes bacterium]|nr:FKBP-type peptidyl-prolyl cis-trans isomerase [Planctomycetota bacterium]
MNTRIALAGALSLALCSAAAAQEPLDTTQKKASYAIGQQLGERVRNEIGLDLEYLIMGLRDAMANKGRLSEDEMRDVYKIWQEEKSKIYLDRNKAKEGVQVTPSGLQYEVLREGQGEKPKATDKVKVHYRGQLTNGQEFDSSYARGKPAEFPVGGVIKGWVEALQMMPVGSKWKLTIPANLAYGDRSPPGSGIPPNSILVFEVELLEILK